MTGSSAEKFENLWLKSNAVLLYRVSQKSVRILFLMYVKTKKDTVMNETVLESAYLGDFMRVYTSCSIERCGKVKKI